MNISEACDLNTVLRYLLGIDEPKGRVRPEDALNAALRLTGRANSALGAGLMPPQVAEAWPMPNRKKKGAPK